MIRYRLILHGTVQGVGCRLRVRAEAVAAGLSGWVRNNPRPDEVEVEVEGPDAAVTGFLERLARLPSPIRVTEMLKTALPLCHDREFVIRR